jgi:hypothetical protein
LKWFKSSPSIGLHFGEKQRFRSIVCVYSWNVMLNAFLWYNIGSVRIFVFHKGLEDSYLCKAEILCQLFSYDVIFENMRILVFHRGLEDLYAHRAETYCQSFPHLDILVCQYFLKVEKLVYKRILVTWYICNDVYNLYSVEYGLMFSCIHMPLFTLSATKPFYESHQSKK